MFDVVAIGGVYTPSFMRDANNSIGIGTSSTVSGNPNHIGLGWTASIDKFIETSTITNTSDEAGLGQWSAPYEYPGGSGIYYANYTITVSDYQHVSNTQIVTPQAAGVFAHLGFSAGSIYINSEILSISQNHLDRL